MIFHEEGLKVILYGEGRRTKGEGQMAQPNAALGSQKAK